MKRELIGYCDVDAGIIWLGDPCYIMGDDASSRVTDWSDFCEVLHSGGLAHNHTPLGDGVGVCVPSGYGDGSYPVYVEYAKDTIFGGVARVKSVTIEFIGEDADEEEL